MQRESSTKINSTSAELRPIGIDQAGLSPVRHDRTTVKSLTRQAVGYIELTCNQQLWIDHARIKHI